MWCSASSQLPKPGSPSSSPQSGVMHYSHLPFVLHSAGEPGPGGAWEGAAVSAEQRYAPQGSAIGPY